MMRLVRRVAMIGAVAAVGAGAASMLCASSALAGSVDPGNGGLLSAAIYNVTPYTWTLVAAQSPPVGGPGIDSSNCRPGCWDTLPQSTIAPGQDSIYRLRPWEDVTGGTCGGDDKYGFDAYMTYRVDVAGGPPEYANLVIWGEWTHNLCLGGNNDPGFAVYFTSAPPPSTYDPWDSGGAAPPAQLSSSQLTFQHNQPYLYDQTLGLAGNYTIDASTDLGAGFVDLLNTLCSGAANTSCSFTQVGPLTWGVGPAVNVQQAESCVVGANGQRGAPKPGAVGQEPPPTTDPDWIELSYEEARTASLSVGAGVTASAELNLFDSISSKISVSLEAETEWQEVQTFERSSKVFIPANNIARVWVAPVIGKVTGTLVLSFGSSTFTVLNFTEVRSGVSKGPLTPAFNVITKTRPMTDGEFQSECLGNSSGGLLGAPRKPGWPKGKAPVRLTPGRGVAGVRLGETQAQVIRHLGQPRVKRFAVDPCRSLGRGCDAVAGTGGTWSYPQLSVVYGRDVRVSGLIYRGTRLSARGVGVGSGLTALRVAYPRITCTRQAKQRLCTLQGAYAGRSVKTVFRLSPTRAGRYKCDRVQIYVFVPSAKSVRA
jgi:hypothetical protein